MLLASPFQSYLILISLFCLFYCQFPKYQVLLTDILRARVRNANKAAHSGFKTQRKHHQKSKTGVPVAPKKDMCPPKTLKKKKKKFCSISSTS